MESHFAGREFSSEQFSDFKTDIAHRRVAVATDEPFCITALLSLAHLAQSSQLA